MPPTNDFVPFCNENTGTNLPTQSAYIANPNLPLGNQPGVASSSFNNKPLRQATTIAAVLAQIAANTVGTDMLDNQNTADHAIPAALLGAMTATLKVHSPVTTAYLSSSGNHNLTFKFQINTPSVAPTAGATYSDGTTTYTVKTTVTGTQLDASGNANPVTVTGTLTKTGGTGDTTLTYYAYRKPIYLKLKLVGGGGGGGGGGTAGGGNGGAGGDTSFGTTLLVAGGGGGGAARAGGGGAGGSASLGTGPAGLAVLGGNGGVAGASNSATSFGQGGNGGSSAFGGAGQGGVSTAGGAANANSGAGGGGGSGPGAGNSDGGTGGGSGGYVDAVITSPLATYAWAVGGSGSVGSAGTGGTAGGLGATGSILVEEHYQ